MAHVTYPPEPDAFFKTLRGRVRAHLEQHGLPRYGNRALHVKLVFLALVYVAGVVSIYLVPSAWWLLVYPCIGVVGIILGLNAGHDAAHLAVYKSRKAIQGSKSGMFFCTIYRAGGLIIILAWNAIHWSNSISSYIYEISESAGLLFAALVSLALLPHLLLEVIADGENQIKIVT